ncbi:hypothetical protein F2Q68_00022712 [Brassica cretica]|uniref:Uncharacterized protein n=1 Tax=Brassica cretica TaxID=69181 RepID=A0A8S9FUU2_BRACR|nr:hypothetical protein F2Q68_00022712 [Brassica cretica]
MNQSPRREETDLSFLGNNLRYSLQKSAKLATLPVKPKAFSLSIDAMEFRETLREFSIWNQAHVLFKELTQRASNSTCAVFFCDQDQASRLVLSIVKIATNLKTLSRRRRLSCHNPAISSRALHRLIKADDMFSPKIKTCSRQSYKLDLREEGYLIIQLAWSCSRLQPEKAFTPCTDYRSRHRSVPAENDLSKGVRLGSVWSLWNHHNEIGNEHNASLLLESIGPLMSLKKLGVEATTGTSLLLEDFSSWPQSYTLSLPLSAKEFQPLAAVSSTATGKNLREEESDRIKLIFCYKQRHRAASSPMYAVASAISSLRRDHRSKLCLFLAMRPPMRFKSSHSLHNKIQQQPSLSVKGTKISSLIKSLHTLITFKLHRSQRSRQHANHELTTDLATPHRVHQRYHSLTSIHANNLLGTHDLNMRLPVGNSSRSTSSLSTNLGGLTVGDGFTSSSRSIRH